LKKTFTISASSILKTILSKYQICFIDGIASDGLFLSEVIYHYLLKLTLGIKINKNVHRLELQTKVFLPFFFYLYSYQLGKINGPVTVLPSKVLIVIKCRSSEFILPKCT